MKQTPPSGVIAPSARIPVKAIAYSDPEKRTVPARKSQPLALASEPGNRVTIHAAANMAMAWYIW